MAGEKMTFPRIRDLHQFLNEQGPDRGVAAVCRLLRDAEANGGDIAMRQLIQEAIADGENNTMRQLILEAEANGEGNVKRELARFLEEKSAGGGNTRQLVQEPEMDDGSVIRQIVQEENASKRSGISSVSFSKHSNDNISQDAIALAADTIALMELQHEGYSDAEAESRFLSELKQTCKGRYVPFRYHLSALDMSYVLLGLHSDSLKLSDLYETSPEARKSIKLLDMMAEAKDYRPQDNSGVTIENSVHQTSRLLWDIFERASVILAASGADLRLEDEAIVM